MCRNLERRLRISSYRRVTSSISCNVPQNLGSGDKLFSVLILDERIRKLSDLKQFIYHHEPRGDKQVSKN